VSGQKPNPRDLFKPADKKVKVGADDTAESESEGKKDQRPSVKWAKRILAAAGAIVTIGGAVTVISHTTHWLGGVATHPDLDEIERSPILGISFYQNGQLDPMSYSGYSVGGSPNPIITVQMTHAPFEMWFPELSNNAYLQVCGWTTNYVFQNAAQAGPNGYTSCLNPGHFLAGYPYGGTGLWLSPPKNTANTVIGDTRAQPADNGDEKYYVANLTNVGSNVYLAVYLNTNGFGSVMPNGKLNWKFQPGNLEDFILSFG
jgi:hypothetical protein